MPVTAAAPERIEHHASFGGWQDVYRHRSAVLDCDMQFAVYLPPQAASPDARLPVLYWLSGLTCNEQNFINKAGAQEHAARHGIILVVPDTSPRGDGVADDAAYDLGLGAGFYVNATQAPWSAHYRMADYVADELPALIEAFLPASAVRAISGHSMGGHGALVTALRNPGRYRSVSAFSPIVAPSRVPWGEKALAAYLGDDRSAWRAWDASALVEDTASNNAHGTANAAGASGAAAGGDVDAATIDRLPLLIDQGSDDGFLAEQLRPELLQAACKAAGHPLVLRMQPGYDHSYYFIASFIGEHIAWHAKAMAAG